jgi:hypothetical protein
MLRIGFAERKITTLGISWSKCKENILACAVIDARGLEEQTVWRIEEYRENFCRGKVAR